MTATDPAQDAFDADLVVDCAESIDTSPRMYRTQQCDRAPDPLSVERQVGKQLCIFR
jgi:hypothetical protein